MGKCVNLANIDSNLDCNRGAGGGIIPKVIFGYHEDVATWPVPPKPTNDTPVSMEAMGVLVGDVVMKANTRAFEFEFTEDTGDFSIVPQGERDAISFLATLNITKRGISKQLLGFQNAAANRKMFFIVEDSLGNKYLMGDAKRAAYMTSGGAGNTTNKTFTEFNEVALQFTYHTTRAYLYDGDTTDLLTIASGG